MRKHVLFSKLRGAKNKKNIQKFETCFELNSFFLKLSSPHCPYIIQINISLQIKGFLRTPASSVRPPLKVYRATSLMRNREVQESLEDQYSSGSEEEYFLIRRNSTGGQAGPSSGAQQAFNATRRRRSAARRRYSDMVSSGDDGDDYGEDVEFGRGTSESHKRAKRYVL
jgi:hypothetical protein